MERLLDTQYQTIMKNTALITTYAIFLCTLLITSAWGYFAYLNLDVLLLTSFPIIILILLATKKVGIITPFYNILGFIIFLCFVTLSSLTATHIEQAISKQIEYFGYFFLVIIAYGHKKLFKNTTQVLLLALSTISILWGSFLQFYEPYHLIPHHVFQIIYRHPFDLGHFPQGVFIFTILILSFSYLWSKPTFKKLFFYTLAIYALIATYARAILLGYFVALAFHILHSIRSIRKQIGIVALLIGVFFIAYLFQRAYLGSKIESTHEVAHDYSFSFKQNIFQRSVYFQQALEGIRERPLMGYGVGNYDYVSMLFAKNENQISGTSHNIFLDIGAESGIFAMLALIFLIGHTLFSIRNNYHNYDHSQKGQALLFIGLTVLFQLNFYHEISYLMAIYFILMGLLIKDHQLLISLRLPVIAGGCLFIISLLLFASQYFAITDRHRQALTLTPFSERGLKRELFNAVQSRNPQAIRRAVDEIERWYPRVPELHSYISDRLIDYGDADGALYYVKKARKFSPKEPTYHEQICIIEKGIGRQNNIYMWRFLYPKVFEAEECE